jgi:hypothetical protein
MLPMHLEMQTGEDAQNNMQAAKMIKQLTTVEGKVLNQKLKATLLIDKALLVIDKALLVIDKALLAIEKA